MAILLLCAAPVQAASLLVYYDGSVSGNDLVDQSGNGYNAVYDANGSGTTPLVLTTTPANSGSGSYVSLPSDGTSGTTTKSGRYAVTQSGGFSYDFNNDSWSMAMFYNRQSSDSRDTLFHIGAGDGFGGENELYAWGLENSSALSLQKYPVVTDTTSAEVNLSASNKMGTDVWHHLAVTFTASGLNDGLGTLSYYVDGTLVGTDSTFTMATTNSFFFGGQAAGTAERNFIGFMDDMALFDDVLSASDIASLANGTQTPIGLVPEPSRAVLMLISLLGLMMVRRRK